MLGLSELRELRQLCNENAKLKRLVADLSLDRHILQEIVPKKAVRPRQRRALGQWRQAVFALSGRRAAGRVNNRRSLLMIGGKLGCRPISLATDPSLRMSFVRLARR